MKPRVSVLLENSRTTDSPPAAGLAEFLFRPAPRPAACALLRNPPHNGRLRTASLRDLLTWFGVALLAPVRFLRNPRRTDWPIAAEFAAFLFRLAPQLAACALVVGALCAQTRNPRVNPDSAVVQDFEKRVAAYLQLRKGIESKQPQLKATASQAKIAEHEQELARAIREARKDAKAGDIFTPEISAEIRRLTGMAMQPRTGDHVKQSLRHAEPVQLHLHINEKYPEHLPLQSTPPSLLENLPPLPPEIEYRITGRDLVLLDTKANLIVDLITGIFS